ncbi:hypothetical protein HA402_008172 [Bradysia odoriphaga]|nr:hypothetical protein HA402_008172 [Bradysia odoriphaga]
MKPIFAEIFIFCIILCALQTCGYSIIKRSADIKNAPVLDKKSGIVKKCDPCPKGIACVPPIQCPAVLRLEEEKRPQMCDLPGESHGYCCTSGHNHTIEIEHQHHAHISRSSSSSAHAHDVHERKQLKSLLDQAKAEFATMMHDEKLNVKHIKKGKPEDFHQMVFRSSEQATMRALDLSHRAMENVIASRLYKRRERIPIEEFELNQVQAFLDDTSFQQNLCAEQVVCPPNPPRYRTENGQCNNYHPLRTAWGSAGYPMERLLPPSYLDGIWEARTMSVHGTPLTNARTISRELVADVDRQHPEINLLFMQFGQLITHDVTQSSSTTTADGRSIDCCTEDGSSVVPAPFLHYSCMPIEIEPHDEFYSQFNQRCINFVRSALAPDNQCKLGYGKQISKVTHYLDGSAIYGSELKTFGEVRAFRHGHLLMFDDFGRPLLPLTNNEKTCALESSPCFFTGDGRSNQIITLTALHQLFAREHNRVASILGHINRHWSDDRIFYETRAIIIAKFQIVIYKEWLPLLIGVDAMQRFGLNIQTHGYSHDYDENVNAAVTSEFSSAAFRFGHSIVDGKLIVHNGPDIEEIIRIPDVMFNSARLRRRNFYDELMNTLLRQPMQQVDSVVTHGLSRFLFRKNNPFGLDLASINIQRGRDHGIRAYNDYLEATGHSRVASFEEFGPEIAGKLARVYSHPDDIDLWIGGLMERSSTDALVGPTFAEIIADQFSRFRKGDRYFFEHNPDINPGAFTEPQLQQLRLTTMSRIICDNADGYALSIVAPNAFRLPHVHGNAPVPCGDTVSIPQEDYSYWKE